MYIILLTFQLQKRRKVKSTPPKAVQEVLSSKASEEETADSTPAKEGTNVCSKVVLPES